MTNKENALRIIRFDKPERVVKGPPTHDMAYLGANHECLDGSGGHDCPVGTVWTDVWGTTWRKEMVNIMGFPQVHPLAEPAAMKSYKWPDPNDERICGRIYRQAQGFDKKTSDAFLCGSHREILWEKSYMLVGMENLMIYFRTEPNYVREVMHRVMDFNLGIAKHYLKLGEEMVWGTDDLGTQGGPLLGPDIVQEFLVPEYRRLFDLYREKGVLIHFHSCGCIESLVDTFADLGINILNPVQATANNLDVVRAKSAGRLALEGGVSSAIVMDGPPERIEAEVRKRLRQLGRDGGYFCAPDQGMPYPKENIEAFDRALEKYGRYPLQEPEK